MHRPLRGLATSKCIADTPLPLVLLQTPAGLSRSRPADENAAKDSEQEYTTYLCGYQPSIVCRLFPFPLAAFSIERHSFVSRH